MLENLELSHYTLNANYRELLAAYELYMKDWSIVKPENREKLSEFLKELSRLLHNYLASFSSFIDHIRVFLRRLENQQLNKGYDVEKKKVKIIEKTQFVKDLRNYSLHIQLATVRVVLGSIISIEGDRKGTIKGPLTLNKEDLMKWDGWSDISRKYLEQFEDATRRKAIPLLSVGWNLLNECQESTEKLYHWLCEKVNSLYPIEIREFLEIRTQVRNLESKISEKLLWLH